MEVRRKTCAGDLDIHICESVVENEEKESNCQLSPAMDHQRVG
jgi:hypothetical protein